MYRVNIATDSGMDGGACVNQTAQTEISSRPPKAPGVVPRRLRRKKVLPGFGLSMGYTIFYLSVIVLIPLSTLVFRTYDMGLEKFFAAVTNPRVLNGYWVSISTAFFASVF